ncbi:zinc finger protein RFP isoform X2 [Pogona vitticeps]
MAAAVGRSLQDLSEEATCSICLDYFKDPVITECGHNFCRACLTHCWEGSEGEEASCPQCREKVRRNLIPNRQLANFVEIAKGLRFQGETITEGKGGACGKHQEPLKLFCKDDEAPICVVCDKSKEHREHQVVPLEEVVQEYKDMICHHLVLLKEKRIKILAYKAETEGKSQHLLKETKAEMEKMKEQFREMSSFLNEQEKLLLAHLEGVEKEIVRKRDEHLAILSEELSSLGGLIQAMDQKCQQPPGELLQDVRSILQTEEKTKTFQNPLAFPPELKLKVWDVCDQNIFLAEMMQQFRDALLTGPVLHKANVTLDPKTASPRLALSEDCKSVRHEFRWQDVEDHPERFNFSPFVLGQEGFTAGRHYWEVTVESGGNWAVGVARKSVWRKGHVGLNTKEGIWAAGKWKSCNDVGSSDPPQSFVSLSGKPRRIRVSLKCDVGQVSFYDADTQSHLYTISGASFTGETFLPFFGVWGKTFLTLRDSSRPRRKSKLVKNPALKRLMDALPSQKTI